MNSLSSTEKQPCVSKVVMQREKYEKDVLSTSQRESLMVKRVSLNLLPERWKKKMRSSSRKKEEKQLFYLA